MAQARRAILDRGSFLAAVRVRLDNGARDFAEAVSKTLARHNGLDPAFESEALLRGLTEIAREHLGTGKRDSIVMSVSAPRLVAPPGHTITVTVMRSELRDWPVITASGYRRLEDCTIEEAEAQVMHFSQTIDGIARRRAVVKEAVARARAAGVSVIGELPDEVLDECLKKGA